MTKKYQAKCSMANYIKIIMAIRQTKRKKECNNTPFS